MTTTLSPEDWGVTRDEARELLRRQICPICGNGPWKSPITHATRMHGVESFALRNACGLTATESVVDPTFRATLLARPQSADTTAATAASRKRKRQRWTSAGREKASAPLLGWVEANPEAAATQLRSAQAAGTASAAATGTPESRRAAQLRRTAT